MDPTIVGKFYELNKRALPVLVGRKNQILKIQEHEWNLKIIMAWFSGGDNNSRFFHKLASNRKSVNSIWKIQIQQNETLTSLKDIQEEAV